jgi:uncharacterized tellurite resistance protein B-like protein
MVIHSDYKEFILYLYVHMAYADGEFHILERRAIYDKICRLYPYNNNHFHLIDTQEQAYLLFDKKTVNKIITKSFKHFKELTFSVRYKIYLDLHDIIHADGKVRESEIRAINELHWIINHTIKPLTDAPLARV